MVNSIFSGALSIQPLARSLMKSGARMIPPRATRLMKTAVRVAIFSARTQADFSPSFSIFWEKVVTKAAESAPSAKRSRSMFGVRNAVTKQSSHLRFSPAKRALRMISRASPRNRLHMMAMETMPVARAWEPAESLSVARVAEVTGSEMVTASGSSGSRVESVSASFLGAGMRGRIRLRMGEIQGGRFFEEPRLGSRWESLSVRTLR